MLPQRRRDKSFVLPLIEETASAAFVPARQGLGLFGQRPKRPKGTSWSVLAHVHLQTPSTKCSNHAAVHEQIGACDEGSVCAEQQETVLPDWCSRRQEAPERVPERSHQRDPHATELNVLDLHFEPSLVCWYQPLRVIPVASCPEASAPVGDGSVPGDAPVWRGVVQPAQRAGVASSPFSPGPSPTPTCGLAAHRASRLLSGGSHTSNER